MNPPPPMPQENGSTTPSVAAAATAASTALPPFLRTSMAVWVASGSTDAAAPPVPSAVWVLGGRIGAALAVPRLAAVAVVSATARQARTLRIAHPPGSGLRRLARVPAGGASRNAL